SILLTRLMKDWKGAYFPIIIRLIPVLVVGILGRSFFFLLDADSIDRCIPMTISGHHWYRRDDYTGIYIQAAGRPASAEQAEETAACLRIPEVLPPPTAPLKVAPIPTSWWRTTQPTRLWEISSGDPWSEEGGCKLLIEYSPGWMQLMRDCGHL
ncbi:MAG: hypothetical protein AAFV53_43875, partial [Myxococcota bacterium]